MTGLYPQQTGMVVVPKEGMNRQGDEYGAGELSKQCVTIAEVLKSAGYGTYMTGKWHLTAQFNPKTEAAKFGWPLQRGFDRYFGFIGAFNTYYAAKDLTRDNQHVDVDAESYSSDLYGDNACTFIEDHVKNKTATPFFLYLAFKTPHWWIQASSEDIDSYKGVYDIGWDQIREQRFAREKELGVVPATSELSPRNEEVPAWSSLNPKQKAEYAQAMSICAGAITAMDRNIGKVLGTLEKTKQRENTLILFLSDNGACAEGATEVREKGPHPSARIGAGWANVGNTPFRYWKNTTWEGGSATELIVNWPLGVPPSQQGGITHELGHLVDIMPTCVELAQATYPKEFKGNVIAPMEGSSLVPIFKGQSRPQRDIFWKYFSYEAARSGYWKLMRENDKMDWMLYDLSKDPTELHDVAKSNPEVVKSLQAKWKSWADRVHAEAGPKSSPKKNGRSEGPKEK